MQSIEIDRSKRLKEQPHTGHNRWHPDIPPLLEVEPGEELVLETRDASDCQIKPGMTVADLAGLDSKVAHPLTGPVYIKGARPGDLLEIEYVDIIPQAVGWTRNRPGSGFLRDVFRDPYLVHWDMRDGWATSPQLPGVRTAGSLDPARGRSRSPWWYCRSTRCARRRAVNRTDCHGRFAHHSATRELRQR
jgi:formamidase